MGRAGLRLRCRLLRAVFQPLLFKLSGGYILAHQLLARQLRARSLPRPDGGIHNAAPEPSSRATTV